MLLEGKNLVPNARLVLPLDRRAAGFPSRQKKQPVHLTGCIASIKKLVIFFISLAFLVQKLAFQSCFLLVINCRRLYEILTLFVLADDTFFLNHTLKAFDCFLKVF